MAVDIHICRARIPIVGVELLAINSQVSLNRNARMYVLVLV